MSNWKLDWWQVAQRQALPLDCKIRLSLARIRQWYDDHDGDVFVSFSGGKDSTVLLDLVRSRYPEVPAAFVDTGLEYPEIRAFVTTVPNVTRLRPKLPFRKVVEQYGYPVVSKKTSDYIHRARTTANPVIRERMLHGRLRNGHRSHHAIPEKWVRLVEAPFPISDRCCHILKEQPLDAYAKAAGRVAYLGTMAENSRTRLSTYQQFGCNITDGKPPTSRPLSFWTEADVWEYLRSRKLPYATIYDRGYDRTGCFACMFGVHMEKSPNRFERMRETHPKLYRYCFEFLKLGRVLDELGVTY